ncbi:hypothetical protein [Methanoregula sp.]|uniref:hypothetical protein n=1 Tax=Methanoregula sp. TaxID=2052170 RepID=UPI003C776AB6
MKKYTVDYLMKTRPHLKKILVILGSLLILIAFSGCTLNGGNVSQTARATITQSIQNASEIDAWCEIQEFNLTIVQNQTAVPVTDEDISPYPEFAIYLHDVNDDPHAWSFGTRLVKDFDCNASRTIQFLKLYRKYEEIPNQPVLEYQGHDYKIGFEYFNAHQKYVPTNP